MLTEAPVRKGAPTRFRDCNVALSWATTPAQLWDKRGVGRLRMDCRAMLGQPGTNDVVDVGPDGPGYFGKQWWSNPKFRLIGIDIDAAELAAPPDRNTL